MRQNNQNAPPNTGNGGILGSGIFGMFGTTIQCKSDDHSMYCNFMKLVNFIIMAALVLFIAYIVYSVLIAKKRR
jgi:membrane associated rhomboid family serine protease